MEKRAEICTKASNEKGGADTRFVGFIGSTFVGVARPKGYIKQLVVFNDHKCKHSIKYQEINIPEGMIVHAQGPVEGGRHDWFL